MKTFKSNLSIFLLTQLQKLQINEVLIEVTFKSLSLSFHLNNVRINKYP
jgi:hypothetical protein